MGVCPRSNFTSNKSCFAFFQLGVNWVGKRTSPPGAQWCAHAAISPPTNHVLLSFSSVSTGLGSGRHLRVHSGVPTQQFHLQQIMFCFLSARCQLGWEADITSGCTVVCPRSNFTSNESCFAFFQLGVNWVGKRTSPPGAQWCVHAAISPPTNHVLLSFSSVSTGLGSGHHLRVHSGVPTQQFHLQRIMFHTDVAPRAWVVFTGSTRCCTQ